MPKLIRATRLRLPNEELERHTTWLEIFFDLIFAVIIAQLSTRLITHLNGIGIFQCAVMFIPVMWTWTNHTVFSARFDNNDAFHWLMTCIIMFAGVIMAIQIPTALESGAAGFAAGFLIAQAALLLLYARTLYESSTPKNMVLFYLVGFGLGGVFWVISLFFGPPMQFIWWTLGMCIYLLVPWIGRKQILSKVPLDTTYIPERFGAFVIIILGQIIAGVVFGLESTHWHLSAVITSVMAFILAMLIWGQYYRFTQMADYQCTLGSGQPYIYAHIPFIISLMIMGACVGEFITNSLQSHPQVNIAFCGAIILYLSSLYLLQRITIRRIKITGVTHASSIIAILILFILYPFSPAMTMSIVVTILAVIFMVHEWLGRRND